MGKHGDFQLNALVAAMVNASIILLPSVAFAQSVKPTGGNTNVYIAPNGVPVVDIATANGAGLSHNRYTQFNVDPKGLVLNNGDSSKLVNPSQLAGAVAANLNLVKPASVILNEVVSNNRSTLAGYMEVVGGKADVIIANPYGITCSGCGFINTPRATLTTGTPNLDPTTGALTGFSVNSGDVLIGGAGIDARNMTYFDIVARSLKIDGQVNALNLNLIAGANNWNYLSQSATPIAGSGSTPLYGIDSTLLGGMYANRITLLATEAGVGVRMLGEAAANADSMTITSSGKIEIQSKLSAKGNLTVTYNGSAAGGAGAITVSGENTSLTSEASVVLNNSASGAGITLSDGVLKADGNIIVASGGTLNDSISAGNTDAGRYAGGFVSFNVSDAASLSNAKWGAGGNLRGIFDTLTTGNNGSELYGSSLALTTRNGDLDVTGTSLTVTGAATLTAQQGSIVLGNAGSTVQSGGDISLTAANQIQNAGNVLAGGNLAVHSSSPGPVHLTLNNTGRMQAGANFTVDGTSPINYDVTLNNGAGGQMVAGNTLNIYSTTFANEGVIQSANTLNVEAVGPLTNGSSTNSTAQILSKGQPGTQTTISSGGALTNYGTFQSTGLLSVGSNALLTNNGKMLSLGTADGGSNGNLVVQAVHLANNGTLQSAGNADFIVQGTLTNASTAAMQSTGNMNIVAGNEVINQRQSALSGKILSGGTLTIAASDADVVLTNAGHIEATAALALGSDGHVVNLTNSGEALGATLAISGGDLVNSGTLQGTNGATINAATLGNQVTGKLLTSTTGTGAGTVTVSGVLDNSGAIHGKGDLTVSAGEITNNGGISSLGNLVIASTDTGIGNYGAIYTPKLLTVTATGLTFTNESSGTVYAGDPGVAGAVGTGDMIFNVGTFRNYNEVIATNDITINATAGFYNLLKGGVIPTVANGGIIWDGRPVIKPGSVTSFDREVGTCNGGIADYECNWYYTWTETDIVNQRIAPGWSLPTPAKLIAAHDININYSGTGQNTASVISGNHAVTFTTTGAASFTNQDLHLDQITVLRRWHNWVHCNACTSDDNYWMYPTTQQGFFDIANYRNQTSGPGVTETSGYDAARDASDIYFWQVGNTSLGPNASVIAGVYSQGQIKFNGSTASVRNAGTTGQLASTLSTAAPIGAGTVVPVTTPGANGIIFRGLDLTLPTNPNGFFVPSKNPNSKYLIETNPLYGVGSGLLGSDYLVSRFGYDPERIEKRLGDANYEAKLVRDELVAQTGRNILAGYDNEAEQMKGLMDSAYTQSAALGLQFGVPLTQEQVANLKQDVVWMVEEQVAGQKVLVPVVYLASATRSSILSGAVIAANDISINGGSLQNVGGTIKADSNLNVITTGSIINTSGNISAGNVSLTSTEGSIINQTQATTGGDSSAALTIIGKTGTIESTGNLSLDAKNNVIVRGADVNAGGDASIKAGQNIVLDTIQDRTATTSSSSSTSNAGLTSSSSSTNTVTTTQIASNLNVGGNLTTRSGNDTTIAGSNVTVGGNADINAAGNLNIIAREDTTTTTTRTSEGGIGQAGGVLGTTATTTVDRTTTNRGSTIVSGGDTTLGAGRTLTVQGSDVAAGRDLTVNATDIKLLAGEDRREVSTHTETSTANFTATANADKVSVGVKTTQETSDSYTLTGNARVSTLSAGRDVTRTATNSITDVGTDITAGRNFTQSASTIQSLAAENRQITSDKSVTMTETVGVAANYGAGQLYNSTRDAVNNYDPTQLQQPNPNVSLDATFNRTEQNSSSTSTQAVASNIRAGGTVSSTSTGQTLLQGTNIAGGGDVTLKAGDLQITAARDTTTASTNSNSIDAAASVTYNGMPGATASGGYGTDGSNASSSTAVVSTITSGGNLKLDSTGDVRLEGTQLGSTGSTTIAGNNVIFEAAKSTEQSSASGMAASASVTAAKGGSSSSGGVSANYSEYSSQSASSTSQAGSINAGTGINIEARTGDLKLEGTNLAAVNDIDLKAKQNIDFTAATNTSSESASNMSAGGGVSGGKSASGGGPAQKFGGVSGEFGSGNSNSNSTERTGGSIQAGGRLNLSSGGDTHLEGTQINAASATLNVTGNFNMESAVSTSTSSSDSTGVMASVSGGSAIKPTPGAKPRIGTGTNSAMGSIDLSSSNSNKVTNQNAAINAGQLTLNVGGNAKLAGADLNSAQKTVDVKGTTTVEQRKDVDVSSSNSTHIRVVAVNKAGSPSKQPPTRGRSNAVSEPQPATRGRSNAVDEGTAASKAAALAKGEDTSIERSGPSNTRTSTAGKGSDSMAEQAKQRANALAQRTESEPSTKGGAPVTKGGDTVATRGRSNAVTELPTRERANAITEQPTRERANAVTERPTRERANAVSEQSTRERSNSVTERPAAEQKNVAALRQRFEDPKRERSGSADERTALPEPKKLAPDQLKPFQVATADTSPAPSTTPRTITEVPAGNVRTLARQFENDDKRPRVPDESAASGNRPQLPTPTKLGPLDPELAKAVDGLRNGKPEDRAKYAEQIAEASTKTAGDKNRVVLGRYKPTGGYSGEANANHGTWFQLHPEAWDNMTKGLTPEQQKAVVWPVNQQFLVSNMKKGRAIEFQGKLEDVINSPDERVRNSYSAMEINFLLKNAKTYGYQRVGDNFVKTAPRPARANSPEAKGSPTPVESK